MSFESTVKKVQKAYFADATVDASGYANFGVTVNVTDEKNSGKFFIAVTDGQFRVEPYAYDDRLCELSLTATVLNSVISGKTNILSAIEKGKITCEGSLEGAEKVQALIASAVPAVKEAEAKAEKADKPAAKKAAKKTEEKPAAKKTEEKPAAKKAEEKPAAPKAEEVKAEAPKTEAPKAEVKAEAPAKKAAKPRTRQKRK